jgi:hypothetical protein
MTSRAQLVLVFSLLAAAIAYNVWVFTRPARGSGTVMTPAPLLDGLMAGGPSVTGEAAPVSIDPTSVPPVPDVGLERRPEWPRNPFLNLRGAIEPAGVVDEPEPDADLVLASILHSPDRQLAIVNGRIVRVGDRIGSATVRDIEPRTVVVETADGLRRTLELRIPLRQVEP